LDFSTTEDESSTLSQNIGYQSLSDTTSYTISQSKQDLNYTTIKPKSHGTDSISLQKNQVRRTGVAVYVLKLNIDSGNFLKKIGNTSDTIWHTVITSMA
jgi:hypothetical protein